MNAYRVTTSKLPIRESLLVFLREKHIRNTGLKADLGSLGPLLRNGMGATLVWADMRSQEDPNPA